MITDADVTKLKKTFATKEDLERFTAKVDKTFLTKKEFYKEFTDDFRSLPSQVSRLALVTGKLQHDVSSLTERMDVVEETMKKILNIVENLLAPIQEMRLEFAAVAVQTTRLNDWAHKVAEKVDVPFDY